MVVTITRGGYAKRTKADLYRAQRRGGKGVRGAQLRTDDIVDHFFVTTTHHWILFFTNKGRVYRAKAYELPDAARDARGQHVANLLAFQPDEQIAQVLALRDYTVAPYLVLATSSGLVKKSRLTDFDSPRSGGIIAINLREDDEVIAARLVSPDEDLLLVSKHAQSIRFRADDEALRPDGPGHLRRDRHAVHRRRPAARHVRGPARAPTCLSPPAAATPSGPPSTSTRSRAGAAAACSPPGSWTTAASWSAR